MDSAIISGHLSFSIFDILAKITENISKNKFSIDSTDNNDNYESHAVIALMEIMKLMQPDIGDNVQLVRQER